MDKFDNINVLIINQNIAAKIEAFKNLLADKINELSNLEEIEKHYTKTLSGD